MHQIKIENTKIFIENLIYLHGNTNASLKTTLGKKTMLVITPVVVTNEWFRNDYVAVCSTPRRSAIEKKEIGG